MRDATSEVMTDIPLNPADKAVLSQLEAEQQSVPARLAEQTGYDRQYIHKRLRRLDEHGIVTALSHGLYRFEEWPDGCKKGTGDSDTDTASKTADEAWKDQQDLNSRIQLSADVDADDLPSLADSTTDTSEVELPHVDDLVKTPAEQYYDGKWRVVTAIPRPDKAAETNVYDLTREELNRFMEDFHMTGEIVQDVRPISSDE